MRSLSHEAGNKSDLSGDNVACQLIKLVCQPTGLDWTPLQEESTPKHIKFEGGEEGGGRRASEQESTSSQS